MALGWVAPFLIDVSYTCGNTHERAREHKRCAHYASTATTLSDPTTTAHSAHRMEPSLLMAPATERDRPISISISIRSDGLDSPSSLPPSLATAAAAPAPKTEQPPTAAAAVYCLCRKPDDGSLMVECGGCAKWFHTRCVGLRPLRSAVAAAGAAIEAEATTTDSAHPAAPGAAAVEWTLSIPEDWRCPRCAHGWSGVPRGRKRRHAEQEGEGEGAEGEDSEAEEAAVEGEVGALLREQGVEKEEDEELAACFRREVWRRRALGAWF